MENEKNRFQIDPLGPAPLTEPERQYYYMAKLREKVFAAEALQKQPPTYFLETFGCQMNEKQSEVVAGILDEVGFVRTTDEAAADVALYNTCTVRENANMKVYGRLGL